MAAPAARSATVASAPLDLLVQEYVDHLLRNGDDSRAGREAVALKLEHAGYDVGRRYAER